MMESQSTRDAIERRVVILDPGVRLREQARRVVRRLGYEPTVLGNLAELRAGNIDPTELEMVMLSGAKDARSSIALVDEARQFVGAETPMLCLVHKNQLKEVAVQRWESMDEVLGRPSSAIELSGIVRLFMRRHGIKVSEHIPKWGGYRFLTMSDIVEINGEKVLLRAVEFDLALEFFWNTGRTLTRDWLIAKVWGKGFKVDSRTLDVSVSRLRRLLRLEINGWDLRAVWGSGYRLERPLEL